MPMKALVLNASVQRQPLLLSLVLLGLFVLVWHLATMRPPFDAKGLTPDQLQKMEFNGDIVRTRDGRYVYNPEKAQGMPGPWVVVTKAVEEFAHAFHKKGTNDHGIGHLIRYPVTRFAAGFLSASVVAVELGVLIGLSRPLYQAFNPFIQLLKPISPLAWMPLLLYTVQNLTWTAYNHPGGLSGLALAYSGEHGLWGEHDSQRLLAGGEPAATVVVAAPAAGGDTGGRPRVFCCPCFAFS